MTTVFVMGGAGFMGCYACAALLERGYRVRVLDSLIDQVHQARTPPPALPADVELMQRDVRDADGVATALKGWIA